MFFPLLIVCYLSLKVWYAFSNYSSWIIHTAVPQLEISCSSHKMSMLMLIKYDAAEFFEVVTHCKDGFCSDRAKSVRNTL